ncbi:MAG: amidohydrolase family protein [Clostridia bacterium]|nr:amidohydrolase family protein [Clostridia bacterium]MBQ8552535.1 amidohydrolase family protein [Clostridia bacterium]
MKKLTAVKNAQLVLENGIVWDAVLLIKDGKIAEYGSHRDVVIPDEAQVIDACGAYVGPGFVDIHVHGGNGKQAPSEPNEVYKHFVRHGETSLLITLGYRMLVDEYLKSFEITREAMKVNKGLKGIYMEGPFINTKYGANANLNPWHGGIPDDVMRTIVENAGDMVRVWAMAPEREDIMNFVTYAREMNPDCVFSIGHTQTTPAQVRALGTKYRPKLITHFGDATGRIPTYGGTRGYGPDEYCLSDPEMYAELISDSCGVHVHPDNQKMLVNCKGYERIVLITDSTAVNNPAPENLKHVTDINFDPRGGICGSKLTMDMACRNIMTHTNCGIAQAFVMASLNPAKIIGMDDKIGSIEKGKIADLVFVDDKFNVQKVMLEGEICKFEE